jgi:hypothetical protein
MNKRGIPAPLSLELGFPLNSPFWSLPGFHGDPYRQATIIFHLTETRP